MKKYRLTLFFAVLLILWLAAGPQILERLSPPVTYTDGLPPSVALDGKLYYTQGFGGIWQVEFASGTVSQWWQPPEGGLVTGIAASPDGTQLAMAYAPPASEGFQTGTTDLFLSGVQQPDVRPLLLREVRSESYRNPAWSPDGRWLYYSHTKPDLNDRGETMGISLTVERLDVTDKALAHEIVLEAAEQASLSPDGTRIVFLKFDSRTYTQELWVSKTDGTEAHKLVAAGSFQALASPKFETSGEAIVFSASGALQSQALAGDVVRAHGEPWNIWRVMPSDNSLTRLTATTMDGPWLDWSPDGEVMAVVSAEGVFVVHSNRFYRIAEVSGEGVITWANSR